MIIEQGEYTEETMFDDLCKYGALMLSEPHDIEIMQGLVDKGMAIENTVRKDIVNWCYVWILNDPKVVEEFIQDPGF